MVWIALRDLPPPLRTLWRSPETAQILQTQEWNLYLRELPRSSVVQTENTRPARGQSSRLIRLPYFATRSGEDAMCRFVEGYQYADGSFVGGQSPCIRITSSSISMIRKFSEMANSFSVSHSLTRDHREVGFSVRISAEESMTRWLKHVPLLNPVQISKFLVWKRFSECPPGLFFSQHIDLLLGRRSVRQFPSRFPKKERRVRMFLESVDLVTQYVLDKRVLTLSEIAEATVAWTLRGAANSVRRLVTCGLARITSEYGKTLARLTTAGQESVFDLTEAWLLLGNQNFRILPLKSYELAANGEKPPRNAEVGQQTLTLASSA